MNDRRQALAKILFGATGIGLRGLATGLPISFLARPLVAQANQDAACQEPARQQYLILSTSASGDPFNANAPGTYDLPGPVHAADPAMRKTPLRLGAVQTSAAQVFSTLPQWALDRATFIHHSTLTNNHPNHPKVLRLFGASDRGEMVPSQFSSALSSCLQTVLNEPVSAGAGKQFTHEGRNLPNLYPTALKELLAKGDGELAGLQKLRDQTVDDLAALLKTRGTAEQRSYMDRLVISRTQARSLSDDLLNLLDSITRNDPANQLIAAVALIRMNITPVVYVQLPFGGDNHSDPDLMVAEVPQHVYSLGHIAGLMQMLKDNGLQDRVTFGVHNVFGRNLIKKGTTGRDHWGSHHVTMLIGKNVKPGVVGGLVPTPKGDEYMAGPFDAKTGRLHASGDVSIDESLASTAKTMGAALGLDAALIDTKIKGGKIISAAIA